MDTRLTATHDTRRLLLAIIVVLAVVMGLGATSASAAPPTVCRVQNTDTGTTYQALQPAVDAASRGARLIVRGTCVGTTIIGKEILYRWTLSVGRRIKSVAVIAMAWHYRSDAFSSVPVVIAVTGAIMLPSWTFLDHLGAVVVSMFILHAAFKITWPSLKELIDAGAPAEVRRRIRDIAAANADVLQVHDIRTRYIGTSIQADLHIIVDGGLTVRQGHDIAKDVEARLTRDIEELVDVVVHVEPPEESLPEE